MFNTKELGLIMGALSAFNNLCEKLDEAKAIGLVPSCLSFPEDHDQEIRELLVKVRQEVVRRERNAS